MPLDPAARKVLDLIASLGRPSLTTFPPQEAREIYRSSRTALAPEPPEVASVEDIEGAGSLGSIPMRAYRAIGTSDVELPVIIYYHGGGFVIGDVDTHDGLCRRLVNSAGCRLISVDYRMAPEFPFPGPVDDSAEALRWVHAHAAKLKIDRSHVAVAGDSAGGGLAATLALMARDGTVPAISFQALLYPVVDLGLEGGSMEENHAGMPLSRDTLNWFYGHYAPHPQHADDWRASPLRADSFKGVAPALVLTAHHDPLRDQGLAYVQRLLQDDVSVTSIHMSDLMHGFLTMGRMIPGASAALDMIGAGLKRSFEGVPA